MVKDLTFPLLLVYSDVGDNNVGTQDVLRAGASSLQVRGRRQKDNEVRKE